MAMSIVHRITGVGLYIGVILLAWFLIALSTNASNFAVFIAALSTRSSAGSSSSASPGRYSITCLAACATLSGTPDFGFEAPAREQLSWETLIGGVVLTLIVWIIGYIVR